MRSILLLVRGCYAALALCILGVTLLSVIRWDGHNTAPTELTVVTPEYEPATGILAPFGPGYERDLLAEFGKEHPYRIRWLTAPDRESALNLLRSGRADLVVGFAGLAPQEPRIVASPAYYHARVVQVTLPALDTPSTELAASQDAKARAERFLSGRYALDARSQALWEPFVQGLSGKKIGNTARDVPQENENHHWFWRITNPPLHAALESFWTARSDENDTLLDRLEERYFGYLPSAVDPYEVTDFLGILERRLPRYQNMIARAVNKAELDPLLFTAVLIQESRLDESTVSHTGVRGIMQLTRRTAEYLNVDRLNPSQAIRGGARYLHKLWKNLEPLELEGWDRWFFALAAFNQGPKRLEGAMELSRKLGGSGRTWKELKEVFPLLSQSKYASMVGQSVCRGAEAVTFVERVRWYYHILCGLVALDRPEAQYLAPLLGSSVRF